MTTAKRQPNVLFILTDDQRHDTIHALGNREIRTPTMDRLVAEGTAFTNACIMGGSHPAVCMPSRAMIMTGRTLFRLHCGDENDLSELGAQQIPPEHTTMPERFRRGGYETMHIGKWHQDRASFNRSFERASRIFSFAGPWYLEYGGHWNCPLHDYDPTGAYPREQSYILAEDGQTHLPARAGVGGTHSSQVFADAAIEYLHGRSAGAAALRPFFMYLAFTAPHDPRHSPEEYEELYDPRTLSAPANFLPRHPFDNGEMLIRDERLEAWPRRRTAIRRHLADYYAMITHVDAQIGRVLDALRASGEYDNTIIVFTGDNGLALGQHGLMGKQNVYQHSVNVPLIVAGPGIPRGVRRDALCYLLDLFPSLCDLCGLDVPSSVEGRSLAPVLSGQSASIRDTLHFAYRDVQRAVRDRRHKYIEYGVEGRRTRQLFDLEQDPLERVNLAGQPDQAPLEARMRRELERWRTELGDTRVEGRRFWSGAGN